MVLGLGLCAATAFAQIPPGLAVTKTCPPFGIPPFTPFVCTFTIQNFDPVNAVNNLAVTNTVPFPGGTPVAVPCSYLGNPVTTLQPFGTAGDTCSGTAEETAHDCLIVLVDLISATGTATDGHPVSGAGTGGTNITDCPPPTPTNTPTRTPTNTPTTTPTNTPTSAPTNTPTSSPTSIRTNTPTVTPVPIVPTLSLPILALLGLALAVVSLLLIRENA